MPLKKLGAGCVVRTRSALVLFAFIFHFKYASYAKAFINIIEAN